MVTLDMSKSIYTLIKEYPDIEEVVIALGHKSIKDSVVLNIWGSMTTLPKAATMNGKSMDELISLLNEKGYDVINLDKALEEFDEYGRFK